MNDERHPYDDERRDQMGASSRDPADAAAHRDKRQDHTPAEPGGVTDDGGGATEDLDDRLLALALGLEDDAELLARLVRSDELRAHFERLQDELTAVADGVLRAVPDEPDAWADLSDERWSALRPYVGTEQVETGRETRRSVGWWRRWQALAPAAAAVVIAAAVFGVVMGRDGLPSVDLSAGGGGASAPSKTAESSSDSGAAAPNATSRLLAIQGAAGYSTVVVARAEVAAEGSQTYTVERTLKGSAPATVRLETEVDGKVASGALAVLFLDPRSDAAPCSTPQALDDSESTPPDAPSPSPAVTGGDGRAATPLYLYNGRCATVLTLPEGVAAGDVQLK